jgi:damage-control phosphatase, subfamily I
MKWVNKCYQCAVNQGFRTLELAQKELGNTNGTSREMRDALDKRMQAALDAASPDLSPAGLSRIPLKLAAELSGCGDPYALLKQETNQHAMDWYPRLKKRIEESDDPLHLGALIAVAGNIIDLGIHAEYDLEETLERVIKNGFAVDHFNQFKEKLLSYKDNNGLLLCIGDNSGEIVFDRLFIEALKEAAPWMRIVYSVKQGPILNDATLQDAQDVGMNDVCEVVTNGNDYIGTALDKCSPQFLELYNSADIIIAKGQGNFETLEDKEGPLFLILQAKCDIVAEYIGVNMWDAVFRSQQANK